jgi:hypothetical protein
LLEIKTGQLKLVSNKLLGNSNKDTVSIGLPIEKKNNNRMENEETEDAGGCELV